MDMETNGSAPTPDAVSATLAPNADNCTLQQASAAIYDLATVEDAPRTERRAGIRLLVRRLYELEPASAPLAHCIAAILDASGQYWAGSAVRDEVHQIAAREAV